MIADKIWKCMFTTVAVVSLSLVLVFMLEGESPVGAKTMSPLASNSGGESYVYLFDSTDEAFVFTFTIPTDNANPKDVIVTPDAGHQEIWFTESGADRIGRLTYTDTTHYAFREYTLTVESRPLNLAYGGGFVWFTEAGRDRIGRLNPATGQVDEFKAPAGCYPADLDYASDGSIWFTEMKKDRIAQLVITSTDDYAVTEYFTPSLSGGRPYGILVDGASVYFAQTENDRVTRFSPPNNWLKLYDFTGTTDVPNGPYMLALESSNSIWTTERVGNRITKFKPGTSPMPIPHSLTPTNSLPTGIAVDTDSHYVWFTQWAAGRIGRFRSDSGFDYYPLPISDLAPTGITVDSDGSVWVLASRPYRVYLPLVARSGG